ncbi:hypothetical protein TRSC58_02733 [Trypanosoma rangeli SC58]|uniref:Uncharacterized protein n=1 Tax=Trypanosoma rangeli SC58 TaxID=429131 RepID=A0A061J3V2_TRYRA|nr:hypothetical protein TRSC58_02733 [Trypanosoma rangeli SC58]
MMPVSTKLLRPSVAATTMLEKTGGCVLPHPVVAVRTVNLPCGGVVVAAGGGVVSVGLLSTVLRPLATQGGVAADAASVVSPSAEVGSLVLTSGFVTCMAVAPLPDAGAALGVVGTSHGSLCLFVVESRVGGNQPALFKVCEMPLRAYSDGLISVEDPVTDVCVGFDPAGRPEFVAAASATCVALVDTQCFDEQLKAKATEAVAQAFTKQYSPHVGRPTNEPFCVSFAAAEVVKLLVPERYHAAFTMDVALVVVLDSGEVRYVARGVVGGSVQLLLEHHLQRQARQSEVGLSMLVNDDPLRGGPRALPHVLYAYSLSAVVHNVCAAAAALGSRAASDIVVNDAALCYDASAHQMRLIVAGTETHSVERPGQPCTTSGWWAIAFNVVCPRNTLQQARSLTVSSFAALNSSSLPRDRCGLAAVLAVPDGQLLFACGNELHVCTAAGELMSGGHGSLRHVYTAGSVVSSMAAAQSQKSGNSAVVVACGASLALLQI